MIAHRTKPVWRDVARSRGSSQNGASLLGADLCWFPFQVSLSLLQRRTIQSFVLGLAASLWTVPAYASDWRWIASGASGSEVFVDLDSMRFNMRRQTDVWVKFDQTKNRRVSERIELQQWHIDCPSRTVSLTASVRYADDNSVISNETFSDDEQRAVPPDTIADEIVSLICEALEAMPD